MKRLTLFLAAVLVVASLAGCSKEKETEKPTEKQTTAPAQQTEKPTEKQTEKQSEDSMNKVRALKGLVISASMNTVEIQTARGKNLSFSTQSAKLSTVNGIQEGNQITIRYKGVITEADTSKVTVVEIIDTAANEEPITKSETEATEAEVADPNATGGTMTGSITDISADRIVIAGDDGVLFYFTLENCKMILRNGIQDGNYVAVTYTGDIYGPDLVPATTIVDNEANDAAIPSTADVQSVTGTVTEASMNNIVITTDNGEALAFSITGVPVSLESGIYLGENLTINYTGTLSGEDTSQIKVVSITANAAATSDTQSQPETIAEPETEAKAS